MVSNDDFDGKTTHLNCFYLHINFEQKISQTGHSDIIITVHIVKKILPSKDDSEELLLSSISSSPAIIDVTNGLLIMAKCVDLRDRDFLEPRRLALLLAAMASLESRLIGCSINV